MPEKDHKDYFEVSRNRLAQLASEKGQPAQGGRKQQPEPPPSGDLSWEALDRMDWHLWILAMLLIFVLGASLLSFMFPTAFWFRDEMAVRAPQQAFFGFCILLALVLVYLLQRQTTVRSLKRQLYRAQAAMQATEREATIQAFSSLPGTGQFRDTLAMEFRRASTSGAHLSVVLLTPPAASLETLGKVVSRLRYMVREGESLYRISDKAVGIILPAVALSGAASFAAQVENWMGNNQGKLDVTVTAYPEEAGSLTELEGRLRGHVKLPVESLQ